MTLAGRSSEKSNKEIIKNNSSNKNTCKCDVTTNNILEEKRIE